VEEKIVTSLERSPMNESFLAYTLSTGEKGFIRMDRVVRVEDCESNAAIQSKDGEKFLVQEKASDLVRTLCGILEFDLIKKKQ
jgi:hypothetical protein